MPMPDRSTLRSKIAAEVRAELARARISGNRLPGLVGKSQSYWSRRLTGEYAMDVDDLAALAELLGVPVTRFFAEPDRPQPGPGGGTRWAPRGSNPEPTGCASEQVSAVAVGPWPGSGMPAAIGGATAGEVA